MRAEKRKFHILYKITCIPTQRFYIGMHSTNDLDDGYRGSGKILWFSRKKHGDDAHRFEIIKFFEDRKSLCKAEEDEINDKKSDPLCMNLARGGEGGWDFVNENDLRPKKGSDGYNRIIDAIRRGNKHPSRKVLAIKNLGTGMSGKKHSASSKEKMSQSHVGEKNSQFGTVWVVRCTGETTKRDADVARLLVEKGTWQYGRKWKSKPA